MKTVKVTDLSGPALDWAVAECENKIVVPAGTMLVFVDHDAPPVMGIVEWSPSEIWAQAGPIIERERIDVCYVVSEDGWQAITADSHFVFRARTPLIAAMRCYVASEIGDTVEVPEELM